MDNNSHQGFGRPLTDDEIADNVALQMRALGLGRTLNDQMRGLGILTQAEKAALQRQGILRPSGRL